MSPAPGFCAGRLQWRRQAGGTGRLVGIVESAHLVRSCPEGHRRTLGVGAEMTNKQQLRGSSRWVIRPLQGEGTAKRECPLRFAPQRTLREASVVLSATLTPPLVAGPATDSRSCASNSGARSHVPIKASSCRVKDDV
eukprot:scaffold704_cov347-Prasinococcus_capsulatus_cf.AAC.25